jgi:succinoglycan biosynthesis protein ExoA
MSYTTTNSISYKKANEAPQANATGKIEPTIRPTSVSVVIPCYNEEQFIGKVLMNLAEQYDREHYEIIVVDGRSTDNTPNIVNQFGRDHPSLAIRIVDNPARNIPAALNLGIRNARGEIIVRMDAHSVPSNNYVRRCVELLTQDRAAVVGMPWQIKPGGASNMARAIALAVAHPFGIGDARYRLLNRSAEFVDTVPFGAFKKELWEALGGFNESLLTNEDYDFNYRVRKGGGRVLLDTVAYSDYFARSTLSELAAQYLRYGRWKAQMVKLHPSSTRLRHLVAPAFVVYLLSSIITGLLWPQALWVILPIFALYLGLSLLFALRLARKHHTWKLTVIIPVVFFVIHCAWGASFLLGLIRQPRG